MEGQRDRQGSEHLLQVGKGTLVCWRVGGGSREEASQNQGGNSGRLGGGASLSLRSDTSSLLWGGTDSGLDSSPHPFVIVMACCSGYKKLLAPKLGDVGKY